MANTASIEGVEIKDYLPGTPLGAAGLESLARASNEFLRTGGAGTVGEICARSVPDAFVGGLAQHVGAGLGAPVEMLAASLCVPTLSTAHVDVRCRARFTVSGAGVGQVRFTTAAGTLTLASGVAGPIDAEGLVTVDTSGDFDDVTVQLAGDVGATVTVHGFWVWYEPIATPVAAGTSFSGAQPFGVASMGADTAYDAMRTDALADLAEHIRDRPRLFWSWVAIAAAVGGDGLMMDRVHRAWVTLHRGAQLAGVTYRIRVNVAAAPGRVYLLTGRHGGWPDTSITIVVAGNGWVDTTFDMPSGGNVLPFPSTSLGIWPWDGAVANPGLTTVDILSLTIWGV